MCSSIVYTHFCTKKQTVRHTDIWNFRNYTESFPCCNFF